MGEPGTQEVVRLEDLEAAAASTPAASTSLSVLVENKPGVLTRIAGLFARRGFNIDTLAVGPTEDPTVSRMTITLDGAAHPIDQVTKQLHKLVNVIKIRDLEPEETIAREMALFKVTADGQTRGEIMQLADIFRGRIIDVSSRTATIEVTGTHDKIEAFEQMVRPFGLVEMVRTGEIAIARGAARPDRCRPEDERGARRRPGGRSRELESRLRSACRRRSSAPRRARAPGARERHRRARPGELDVAACVFASRACRGALLRLGAARRDGFALGALGSAWTVEGVPAPDRFAAAAARCAELDARTRCIERRATSPARGPVWVGGFAFAPDGGSTPGVAARCRRRCWCCRRSRSCAAGGRGHRDRERRLPRRTTIRRPVSRRAARAPRRRCEPSSMPLVDPDPLGGLRDRERAAARGATCGAVARGARADPRRRAREGRARARGAGRSAVAVPAGGGVRRLRAALPELLLLLRRHAGRRLRRREPGAAGAARGRAPSAPSRWPAPPGAAPTPPSTTTSASACCTAPRTATSTRSSRARSSARSTPLSVWVAAADGARAGQGREHPAPRDADARPARRAAQRGRARRRAAPDARRRRRAVGAGARADRRARAARPRLVRGPGGLDGRHRGRRVLRRAALRAARRAARPTATRASASSPTPTPRPSWPRPR